MKINKVEITVQIETTHVDSVPALLRHMEEQWLREVKEGALCMQDGDEIIWGTTLKPMEI